MYIVVVYDVRLNDFEWSRKKSLRAAFFLDIFFLLFVGSVVCVCNKEAMKKKKKKFFYTISQHTHFKKRGGGKNIFRADRFTMQPAVFSFLLVFVLTGHITHTNTQREKAK